MNTDPHTPLLAELRPRSYFNRALVCSSPMHGVEAFGFQHRQRVTTVLRGGVPFASTDGHHFLAVGDRRFEFPGGRFTAPMTDLVAGDQAFRLVWGLSARDPVDRFDGVRITVDGHPGEEYLATANRSWFAVLRQPHVTIHATRGEARLERMLPLLAFFWAHEQDHLASLG